MRTRSKGEGQEKLPGMKQSRIKEIHEKALEVKGYEKKRMEFLGKETGAREELKILMNNHKLEHYEADGVTVNMKMGEPKALVKVNEDENPD